MKRRSVIKGLTFLPIAGSLFPFKSAMAAPSNETVIMTVKNSGVGMGFQLNQIFSVNWR